MLDRTVAYLVWTPAEREVPMVAKPGFEDVNLWLEGSRVKFQEQLAAFASGMRIVENVAGSVMVFNRDVTANYIRRRTAQIDFATSLIAKHSLQPILRGPTISSRQAPRNRHRLDR